MPKIIPPNEYRNIPDWAETVFAHIERGAKQYQACGAVGINPTTLWRWRKNNEEFSVRYEDAIERYRESYRERIESEIDKRSLLGTEEPVIYKGQAQYRINPDTGEYFRDEEGKPIPLTVRKKSDQLLMFKAKAEFPEKYGQDGKSSGTTVNVQQNSATLVEGDKTVGGNIQVIVSDEKLREIQRDHMENLLQLVKAEEEKE